MLFSKVTFNEGLNPIYENSDNFSGPNIDSNMYISSNFSDSLTNVSNGDISMSISIKFTLFNLFSPKTIAHIHSQLHSLVSIYLNKLWKIQLLGKNTQNIFSFDT